MDRAEEPPQEPRDTRPAEPAPQPPAGGSALQLQNYYLDEIDIKHCPLGKDRGEDFLFCDHSRPGLHLQAVFDGCGGAGSWKYDEFQEHSGAYIAARSISGNSAGVGAWFDMQTEETCADPQKTALDYQAFAKDWLVTLKETCKPMSLVGSLVRSFPCTADIALMQLAGPMKLNLTTLHCGDSRVYALTPQGGLVQLTDDDTKGHPDPLESLRLSAPLSDMLNADTPFTVKPRRVFLPMPCAILCATDGVFGYVRSPMDFEHLLLTAIAETDSMDEFETELEKRLTAITGDDTTLIMSFYGWGDLDWKNSPLVGQYYPHRRRAILRDAHVWDDVKAKMEPRRRQVAELIERIDGALDQEAALQAIWPEYRNQTVYSATH